MWGSIARRLPFFRSGARQQAAGKQVAFLGDAAFAKPEVYEASEERGVQYAIRIPANKSLELEIEDILFRPPGKALPEAPAARVQDIRSPLTIDAPSAAERGKTERQNPTQNPG